MGGRTVRYHGADFTRPMKDNIRENLFNILGQAAKGAIAIDLFAGTGALGLEALSRGATRAIIVEQNRLAVKYIQETVDELDVNSQVQILIGDAFRLSTEILSAPKDDTPWIVFLSPPYALWHESLDAMNAMVRQTLEFAPPGSVLVCETDKPFDVDLFPKTQWDHRPYGNVRLSFAEPAMVCGMNL